MSELVVFDVYLDWNGPATNAARILLWDDQHWKRLPVRQPPNIWGDDSIPLLGDWCKFDESMGLTAKPAKSGLSLNQMVPTAATRIGPLTIGGNQQNREMLSAFNFFPAQPVKQGRGRNAATRTTIWRTPTIRTMPVNRIVTVLRH